MVRQVTKALTISFMILIAFNLLLLLPREIKLTIVTPLIVHADFPFSFELYQEKIHDFIKYIQTEKGLGLTNTGVPITEEVRTLLGRSLLIIIPCFFISFTFGTFIGVIQFYFREKIIGKLFSSVTWLLSSIPDFFLYISIQYLLIKLIKMGLPHFNLYGNDHWYSFMLPLIALLVYPMIHVSKYVFISLEKEETEEYVRTSYAKGLTKLQVLLHMLWNCIGGLLNQAQVIMVYILTSLPIIEILSSYRGAGYQLLQSILGNEDARALGYMIPFILIMLFTILTALLLKHLLLPQNRGESS